MVKLIEKKIDDDKKDKALKSQGIPYSKMLLTYADSYDKLLIFLGYFTAIVTGMAMPSFVFIFGNVINSFGDDATKAIN